MQAISNILVHENMCDTKLYPKRTTSTAQTTQEASCCVFSSSGKYIGAMS